MELRVFQSDKGDCLLLTGENEQGRVLIDGGMPNSYSEHVAPALDKLRKAGKALDVVYVSHIDQDHIGGVLRMLDDEVAWQIHDLKTKRHIKSKRPTSLRPPKIRKIWHNAFHEQIKDNARDVENLLAASAPVLFLSDVTSIRQFGQDRGALATSIKEAIQVSRRIGSKQLGIPLNPEAKGKLMLRRKGQKPFAIGSMTVHIVGPSRNELEELKEEWIEWLRDNKEALKTIRQRARDDESNLGQNDVQRFFFPLLLHAKELGNREDVTTPNLASLTLLVSEGKQTVLLTGDAHCDDILAGLEETRHLDANRRIHVTLLKAQHHGSDHNFNEDFCNRVSADHYVFCGNGFRDNPELDVIQLIFDRRMANRDGRKFKFWFNSSADVLQNEARKGHMDKVEQRVNKLESKSKGRLTSRFLKQGSSMVVLS
jgi:beta-lactamase superfamily II metal-dependent hydrolase